MTRFLSMSMVLLFAGCSAYHSQKAELAATGAPADRSEPVSAASADPEIVKRFERHNLLLKQATLLSELDLYKNELAAEGKYECCVSPGCNECPIRDGECHCKHTVAASGPCCGECTAAWIDGRGDIPGVDKEQVLASLGCVRELYEKKMPDTAATPAAPAPKHHH